MNAAQGKLYWRLWAMVRRAQPSLDRKALHAELGLPESHTRFGNDALDLWKARCLAIAEPTNLPAQIAQVRMPATRRRYTIRQIATALGVGENYLDGIVSKLFRSRPFATLDNLDSEDAQRVLIAITLHARRKRPTKATLLAAVQDFCAEHAIEDADAIARAALHAEWAPPIAKLPHDELLLVLGALVQHARERSAVPA